MKNKLLCPICKEKTAKQSSTYPDSLVCYCGGDVLKEVGTIQNNKIISKNNLLTKTPIFSSIHFDYEHISQKADVMVMGTIFKNALSNPSFADQYMKKGEIWVAKFGGKVDHEFSVIFVITHKDRTFTNHFTKDLGPVPSNALMEIKNFLISQKIALKHIPNPN